MGSRLTAHGSRLTANSDSSGEIISFKEFREFCESLISEFNLPQAYFIDHSLRLYNTFKFVSKLADGRSGLTLLAPGGGPAFVEACLTKYMGFKCTIWDLPEVVSRFREYYDWAGFESVGMNIDAYTPQERKSFDFVMSLENIEHIHAAPSEYIAKFVNTVAPGGYFVISTPNCGSIAHVVKVLMMVPILGDPKITFDLNSHTHYREYMPCEIIRAYEENGLTFRKKTYTNTSPAMRKYDTSRLNQNGRYVENPVLKFLFRYLLS